MKEYKNYYDDFGDEETIEHTLRKTITESDNNLFCLLTMNHHPVHTDYEYAKKAKHKQVLVPGTYVISLVVGLSVPDLSGAAVANLGYNNIKHMKPVFINDTISAKSKVLSKEETKSKTHGTLEFETTAYNQRGELVLSLERTILVKKIGKLKCKE